MARRVAIASHELFALISCCGGEPKLYPITSVWAFESNQAMFLAADDIAKKETTRTGMQHKVVGVRIEIKGSVDYVRSGKGG